MKKRITLGVVVALILTTTLSTASNFKQNIEVLVNQINITVDGQKVKSDNFVYKGTTYVPLREISEMLGKKVEWKQETSTASIGEHKSIPVVKYDKSVDPINPIIDLSKASIKADFFKLTDIKGNIITVPFNLENKNLKLFSNESISVFSALVPNSKYILTILDSNNNNQNIEFKTSNYNLKLEENEKHVFIRPNPSKGFNFPYMLYIPSKENSNLTTKTHLVVETYNPFAEINPNYVNDAYRVKNQIDTHAMCFFTGMDISRGLSQPLMIPIISRPQSGYWNKENNINSLLYTTALDRDSMYLEELVNNKNIHFYEEYSVNFKPYYRIDKQVTAMIKDAQSKLKSSGIKVEDKIIAAGFSASGDFMQRYTFLNPDKVKVFVSGSTLASTYLPISKYNSVELSYPFGTSDYKYLTGKEFNLSEFNSVARLHACGAKDMNITKEVEQYYDQMDAITRKELLKIFPGYSKARLDSTIDVLVKTNTKGIFIIDKDIDHNASFELREYIVEFVKANINSDTITYPSFKLGNRYEYKINK